MSLIQFSLPKDPQEKIRRLRDIIEEQTAELETIQEKEVRAEQKARVEKWSAFLRFMEAPAPMPISIFPMMTRGSGSTANLLISLVVTPCWSKLNSR